MPGKTFIIDANVMMEAANVYYAFDHVPGFWEWLANQCAGGVVRTVSLVNDEIDFPGELVDWAADREPDGFFIDVSDHGVQAEYQRLAAWVVAEGFGPQHVAKFLDGADLWIVAAAIATGRTVVTQEKSAGNGSKKIKIPDVCRAFGVECFNTFDMLKELNARF